MTHESDTIRSARRPGEPSAAAPDASGREGQREAGGAIGAVGGAAVGMAAAGPAGAVAGALVGGIGGAIAGGSGGRSVVGDDAAAAATARDASIASAVGSDDLPPGPRGEGEPDPARNPDDLGERIRRSGPTSDRVFDDTDRELPSDRDFEGGDAPFGERGQLPLGTPPLEPGQI